MAKITYTDKVALNEEPSVAEINKVTDDNMNEIKTSVNDLYDTVSDNTTDIQNNTLNIGTLQNQTMGAEDMGSLVATGIRSKNFINKYDYYGSNQSATTYTPVETGIRATLGVVAENQWGIFRLPIELLGKTCTFSLTMTSSSSTKPLARIYYGREDNNVVQNAGFDLYDVGTKQTTNTFLNTLPTGCTGIYMLLYANRDGTGYSVGAYSDFLNLQLEEGNEKTFYADYFSPVDALGNCTTATGQYTTASWSAGTNTCTWTAPKTGYYLIFAKFMANAYTDAQAYKQFQIKGTATRIAGDLFFFQEAAQSAYVEGIMGCLPIYAVKGQTIIPYVHTDAAGKVWNIALTGLYIK